MISERGEILLEAIYLARDLFQAIMIS